MKNAAKVVSLSGEPILRHGERTKPFELAVGSPDSEILEAHIETWLGPIEHVFREPVSDLVHIDIRHVGPAPGRPFHFLVTTGMSDRRMSPPENAAGCRYAELMMTLPATWEISPEAFENDANYWPVRALTYLARFPHVFDTWLWWGHTVPNGEPPLTMDDSVEFVCGLLAPPLIVPEEFHTLRLSEEKQVSFFSVIPLYREEMDLKLQRGVDALLDLFDEYGINELVDVHRPNVAAQKRWQLG